jgi:hypothetical protein
VATNFTRDKLTEMAFQRILCTARWLVFRAFLTNFYEKALFVKPTWRPRSRPAQ